MTNTLKSGFFAKLTTHYKEQYHAIAAVYIIELAPHEFKVGYTGDIKGRLEDYATNTPAFRHCMVLECGSEGEAWNREGNLLSRLDDRYNDAIGAINGIMRLEHEHTDRKTLSEMFTTAEAVNYEVLARLLVE